MFLFWWGLTVKVFLEVNQTLHRQRLQWQPESSVWPFFFFVVFPACCLLGFAFGSFERWGEVSCVFWRCSAARVNRDDIPPLTASAWCVTEYLMKGETRPTGVSLKGRTNAAVRDGEFRLVLRQLPLPLQDWTCRSWWCPTRSCPWGCRLPPLPWRCPRWTTSAPSPTWPPPPNRYTATRTAPRSSR